MKRVKPVYFHDQRGFLLTFGPDDNDLHRWSAALSSDRIRDIFGIESFAGIRAASGAEGVRRWMRERLRIAMQAEVSRGRAGEAPVPPRAGSWQERDLAVAPRIERLLESWAPEAARVLDPFAGSGLYPAIASRRDVESFWCEISPVQRFLTLTRFRALYREDAERRQLASELFAAADGIGAKIERAAGGGLGEKRSNHRGTEGTEALLAALRPIADDGVWESSIGRDLFRAAVVSLLNDGEPVTLESVADEMRRYARYIGAQQAMRTFPTLLADDAADIGGMRSIRADVLLTSLPCINSDDAVPEAAEFLGIDARAGRTQVIGEPAEVPRGRGTSLHMEHSLRHLREAERVLGPRGGSAVERLVEIVAGVEEPGKAATLARYFAALARTSAAIEHQLAAAAVAIVDVPDTWIAGRLIRNADTIRDLFETFGFDEVAAEATPTRVVSRSGEPLRKEHRVTVMRRSARSSRPAATGGWAAWA